MPHASWLFGSTAKVLKILRGPTRAQRLRWSNDARAIQQLHEITPCEPRIQRALVYYVHTLRRWLASSGWRVASEHRHILVRVIQEAKQIYYRSPLEIGDVHRLLQHCVAKPAAQYLRGEIDFGGDFVGVCRRGIAERVAPSVKQLMNFGIDLVVSNRPGLQPLGELAERGALLDR